jgi:hypothetical protein
MADYQRFNINTSAEAHVNRYDSGLPSGFLYFVIVLFPPHTANILQLLYFSLHIFLCCFKVNVDFWHLALGFQHGI